MAQVLGFGGVFFKAEDPAAVREWYRRVLGFEIEDWGGATFQPAARGQQVWAAFPTDTQHFEPSGHPFMVNLMVDDLEGVLEKAKAAGVEPIGREDADQFGRFAWILDPAGFKVELWEPKP